MLATKQLVGGLARARGLGSAATGIRRLATVSDSPLDRKVSVLHSIVPAGCALAHICR